MLSDEKKDRERMLSDEKKDRERILSDRERMLSDEKKDRERMLSDEKKAMFNFISMILCTVVGSITLYFTVVHTGDRLVKGMVLSNTNVSDKEILLRNIEDMSKAISTGAAQGLNHTIVGYPQWWLWNHPKDSRSIKVPTSNPRTNEKEK
jgi:hypothetical protein